jgi:hypothetical protein
MFSQDLHNLLGLLSVVAMGGVAVEAGVRTTTGAVPGRWADRAGTILVLLVVVTAAGGVALLLGGYRPHEMLHIIYAALFLATVPVADSLVRQRAPRARGGARLLGALVGLGIAFRLFTTG